MHKSYLYIGYMGSADADPFLCYNDSGVQGRPRICSMRIIVAVSRFTGSSIV